MYNRFQKGSGAYTCQDCGKLTRDTSGEAGVGLCRNCYEAAEWYNYFQDGEMTEAEFAFNLRGLDYQGKDFSSKLADTYKFKRGDVITLSKVKANPWITIEGIVDTANNWGTVDKPDWYIEFHQKNGTPGYWKQQYDGGEIMLVLEYRPEEDSNG